MFVVCNKNASVTVILLARLRVAQEVLVQDPLEVPMEESTPLALVVPAVQVVTSTPLVERNTPPHPVEVARSHQEAVLHLAPQEGELDFPVHFLVLF